MFDIGMPELVVIFIVALLVFGPNKLPELGKTLGRGLGELKKALQDVKDSVQDELQETTSDIRDAVTDVKSQITKEVHDAGKTIGKTVEQVKSEVSDTGKTIGKTVEQVKSEVNIDEEIKSAMKDVPKDTKKEPDSSSSGNKGNTETGSAKT